MRRMQNRQMTGGETRMEMMVGGVRKKPGAGGDRWGPRVQPGRMPTLESREEGYMAEMPSTTQ